MAIPQRIRDYLDSQNVPYELLHHSMAFTAQEIAHSLHVSGRRCAKSVVLEGDGKPVMAVIPASNRLNVQEFRATLEVSHLEMLPEDKLSEIFPDCDRGAIPPFGNLYGIDVWVDRAVGDMEQIVFCGGTHEDCMQLKYGDFARLTKPRLGRFSDVWTAKAA
jgi:Ala-tRNA(Pro) deacylase